MYEFVQIISHTNSYVAQCIHCRSLEIVHGNCLVHLSQQQWNSFIQYIHHVLQTHPGKNPLMKTIMLDIAGTEFFQMYLTGLELEAYDILEKADDEMKAQNLIRSFDQLS